MNIDWKLFVATEQHLHRFHSPIVVNGIKYATDARVLIAVPTDEPDTPVGNKRIPDFEQKLCPTPVAKFLPWPREGMDCGYCLNTGVEDCGKCLGMCYRICDMGHEHDCDCTSGVMPCTECRDNPVVIGSVSLSKTYARLIASLPGPVEWSATGYKKPLHFRFGDSGRGAVMGIDKKSE